MANPSLQIGNGKFAIKENDLLGYSSSGTRFFPIPITMTRATLGTRVNPSGLVENVELLGSEEVDCGNFECANPDGVWSTDLGWGISGGTATYDGSQGTKAISQSIANVQLGTFCKVTIDVLSNQGSGANTIFLGGTVLNNNHLDVGSYTFYGSFTTNTNLYIYGRSGEVFQIDNVSVKEVTRDGLARVDYTDGTGSLLVEPQRTNLITYSEDFTQSVWAKENGGTGDSPVVTSNIGISPDGTQNADKIVFDLNGGTSSSDLSQLRFSLSSLSGDYTNSIYLKSFDGASYNVSILDANGTVNTATITNEWQRFEYYNGGGTTSANPFRIRLRGNETTSDNAALLIYGAQLEAGSYPTSYIKTQGSSVTRNKDEYTKTGISDKINSEEGVLFVEMAALSNDGTQRAISIYKDTSLDNLITIQYNSVSNNIRYLYRQGVVSISDLNFAVNDIKTNHKIAATWKQNEFKLFVDGIKVGENLIGNIAPQNTFVGLYFRRPDGNNLFGKVKQLQIFKTALSDSELATLTTI